MASPPVEHVLFTNDYPPKIGGIQSYLYELWRRLDPERFAIYTSASHKDAPAFDAAQPYVVRRGPWWLAPTPAMRRRALATIADLGPKFVVLDPAVPLGMIGTSLGVPYVVVLHGAEVTVPARLPLVRKRLANVLEGATHVISAGQYAADEAQRLVGHELPTTVIAPGVDVNRFVPIDQTTKLVTRRTWNLAPENIVIVGHSRLVPRKGFDTLIRAVHQLNRTNVTCIIVGKGRDRKRLEKIADNGPGDIRFLGRVADEQLPTLLGACDISAMLCHNRWYGLEQEGFGIVFLEAAAVGIAQLAGRSGGAAEAVVDGQTGLVLQQPTKVNQAASALAQLIDDAESRSAMGTQARKRVESEFSYDILAKRLGDVFTEIAQGVRSGHQA